MLTGSAAILKMTRSASLIQICVDENKRALTDLYRKSNGFECSLKKISRVQFKIKIFKIARAGGECNLKILILNCTSDIFSNCTRKPFDFLVIIWPSKIFSSKKNSQNKCQMISARRKLLQVARGHVARVLSKLLPTHFDWLKLTAHCISANQQERFHFFAHV